MVFGTSNKQTIRASYNAISLISAIFTSLLSGVQWDGNEEAKPGRENTRPKDCWNGHGQPRMGGSGRSLLVVVVASGSVFALFLIVFRVQLVTVVPFCPPSRAMTTRVVFFAGTRSNGAPLTPAALRKLWRGGGQEDHTSPPRKVDAKKHGAPHHPKPKAT